MEKLHNLVADMVELAGGEITGRIRLQKIAYLLDQKGLRSGADYIYYHYGPYSENIADGISDAKFWGRLQEKIEFRKNDGAPYSVFNSNSDHNVVNFGSMDVETAKGLLLKLKLVNSTVLELAATVHWLAFVEKVPDWKSEILRRKAGKTEQGRLEQALNLLAELNLAPTSNVISEAV